MNSRLSLYSIAFCALFAAACGRTPSGPDGIEICWVDQVRFDDVRFTAQRLIAGRQLTEADLGPRIGTVRFKVDGNIEDPDYRLRNGDATFLEPGTAIFAVAGYRGDFRRAALVNGEVRVYEADLNDSARTGSDLLDVGGRVDSVGVFSNDERVPLGVVRNSERVDELEAMVLGGRVEVRRPPEGEIYGLVLYLADGTAVIRSYRPGPNLLADWIALPSSFRSIIEEALVEGSRTPWNPDPLRSVGATCGL